MRRARSWPGPEQFLGYQDPSADGAAFVDQTWFRTGDLGRFDEDGYLIVTDRVKDIIIRGGENISAPEVEEAVAGHPPSSTWPCAPCTTRCGAKTVCAVGAPRRRDGTPVRELEEAAA